jgi:hypothetical protein
VTLPLHVWSGHSCPLLLILLLSAPLILKAEDLKGRGFEAQNHHQH